MISADEQYVKRRAVLVSVAKEGAGFRISLDDVKCQDKASGQWVVDVHYTNKLIPAEAIELLEFDEKELADFGCAILARLYAFNQQNEI